jgi:citrate synthase
MSAAVPPDQVLASQESRTRSAVCHLDADAGRLTYRGYDAGELALHATFEQTAWLLVRGELPSRSELKSFRREWIAAQKPGPLTRKLMKLAPPEADGLTVLRTVVSALPFMMISRAA